MHAGLPPVEFMPYCPKPVPVDLRPLTGLGQNDGGRVTDNDLKCFDGNGCPSVRPSQVEVGNAMLPAKNFNLPVPIMMETGHIKRV